MGPKAPKGKPDQTAAEREYEGRQREELASLDEQENEVLKRTLRKRGSPRGLLQSMRAVTARTLSGGASTGAAGPSGSLSGGAAPRSGYKQMSLVG